MIYKLANVQDAAGFLWPYELLPRKFNGRNLKINPLEKEKHLPNLHFGVSSLFWGGKCNYVAGPLSKLTTLNLPIDKVTLQQDFLFSYAKKMAFPLKGRSFCKNWKSSPSRGQKFQKYLKFHHLENQATPL